MKVIILYDYPASPSGLAVQGDLLYRGLCEEGVDAFAVNYESTIEKEWYYRWFRPDVAVGVGYWGYTPHIIQDPLDHGITPVPWLVADGYVANYRETLNQLPLVLVTSNWVREVYARDGIETDRFEVLPVGCDTNRFKPRSQQDPRVAVIREQLGIGPDETMILTAGGDAASKGAHEVMQALAQLEDKGYKWKYVCKVWPQPRTIRQNEQDNALARQLGIADHFKIVMDIVSRNYTPYLLNACDIYAAPSRLEGFGMFQVEANASGKPVVGLNAMGMRDTMIHGETALLASVGVENRINQTVLGLESGYEEGHTIEFDPPRIADYRARVDDLVQYFDVLLRNPSLRQSLGRAGRKRVVENFNYRVVTRRFLQILHDRLGLS